jgi:hypothetical protein
MVRAFTISFEFDGRVYLALASIKTREKESLCSVRIFDDSLERIVPERQLTYSNENPLCPTSLHHPSALRLFSSISNAVDHHLQAQ